MSNLGTYQWATTNAKKVGGMGWFLTLIAGVSAVIGALFVQIFKPLKKAIRKVITRKKKNTIRKTEKERENSIIYTVINEGESNEGLKFNVGDKFTVLESDGDAVLIEKHGDDNNPYFVSAELLKTISDYHN